jgi:hypothetical protein
MMFADHLASLLPNRFAFRLPTGEANAGTAIGPAAVPGKLRERFQGIATAAEFLLRPGTQDLLPPMLAPQRSAAVPLAHATADFRAERLARLERAEGRGGLCAARNLGRFSVSGLGWFSAGFGGRDQGSCACEHCYTRDFSHFGSQPISADFSRSQPISADLLLLTGFKIGPF